MSRDLIETGLGWHYRPERIARLLGDPETVTVVACDREQTAGFAIMSLGDARARIVLFAVQPSHQRRGIGRRMMEWLEASAAAAGIAVIKVELRARNRAAYALYRANGFAETVRLQGYYSGRESAICMIRLLRDPYVVPPAWSPPARDER